MATSHLIFRHAHISTASLKRFAVRRRSREGTHGGLRERVVAVGATAACRLILRRDGHDGGVETHCTAGGRGEGSGDLPHGRVRPR
jgi:hypothetical protein